MRCRSKPATARDQVSYKENGGIRNFGSLRGSRKSACGSKKVLLRLSAVALPLESSWQLVRAMQNLLSPLGSYFEPIQKLNNSWGDFGAT